MFNDCGVIFNGSVIAILNGGVVAILNGGVIVIFNGSVIVIIIQVATLTDDDWFMLFINHKLFNQSYLSGR